MFKRLRERIGMAQVPVPWGLGGALAAMVAAFAAVVIGTTIALSIFGQMQAAMLIGWTLGAGLTIAFVIFSRRQPEQAQALRLGKLRGTAENLPAAKGRSVRTPAAEPDTSASPLQDLFLLLLVGVGMAVTLDVIAGRVTGVFLPEPELIEVYSSFLLTGQGPSLVTWLFALCFMAILQPLGEELVFRGLALPALRRTLGPWMGYLLSAALYGLFHWMVYPTALEGFAGIWYGFLSPFAAGLVYGAVRLYMNSTRAAALVHAAFGLFAVIKLLTLVG